jgi:hypothetical protein
MTDKEMLLMAYGALKALRSGAAIVRIIEAHLWPDDNAAVPTDDSVGTDEEKDKEDQGKK